MAQGSSGRIVIDVDPEFKQELYGALKDSGSTLKDWFMGHAAEFCSEYRQPNLLRVAEEPPAPYTADRPNPQNRSKDVEEHTQN